MSDPEERMKHATRRTRNFVAKKLREDARFRQKIVPKRRKDSSGDYDNLDQWLRKGFDYDQEVRSDEQTETRTIKE